MSNVILNIKTLIKLKLTPNQYFFLYLISNPKSLQDLLKYIEENGGFDRKELLDLINRDFLKLKDPDGKICFNNIEILKPVRNSDEDWFEDWFELWPTGQKNAGGVYLRTDKEGCQKKMKSFLKTNQNITSETIMKATANYIERQRLAGYSFSRIAPYFIEKDKVSFLLAECENMDQGRDGKKAEFLEEI